MPRRDEDDADSSSSYEESEASSSQAEGRRKTAKKAKKQKEHVVPVMRRHGEPLMIMPEWQQPAPESEQYWLDEVHKSRHYDYADDYGRMAAERHQSGRSQPSSSRLAQASSTEEEAWSDEDPDSERRFFEQESLPYRGYRGEQSEMEEVEK